MRLATESLEDKEVWVRPIEFRISKGMLGFPEDLEFELLVNGEELPFMWIRSKRNHQLGFVVIEPSEILCNYEIEVADDDAETLGIEKAGDALILNIVTIREGGDIESATVNLVAPIILNRNTLLGKQVIVSNHMRFSTKHSILKNSVNG
ncbi:MAG: flagellar assembly protein FliW [Opitutales bacterium]|jgi:flagellar assembly factor FliW